MRWSRRGRESCVVALRSAGRGENSHTLRRATASTLPPAACGSSQPKVRLYLLVFFPVTLAGRYLMDAAAWAVLSGRVRELGADP